jgi:hypothetical protein
MRRPAVRAFYFEGSIAAIRKRAELPPTPISDPAAFDDTSAASQPPAAEDAAALSMAMLPQSMIGDH